MKNDKTFYLNNGRKFSNLKFFVKELIDMPKEVYNHHVNNQKNDFSEWIEHSLKEKDLAKKIQGEIDKIELELKVLRHLVHGINKKPVTKAITKKKVIAKKPVSKNKK